MLIGQQRQQQAIALAQAKPAEQRAQAGGSAPATQTCITPRTTNHGPRRGTTRNGSSGRHTPQRRPGTLREGQRLDMPGVGLQPLLQRLAPGIVERIVSEQHRPLGSRLANAALLRILANHAHCRFSLWVGAAGRMVAA